MGDNTALIATSHVALFVGIALAAYSLGGVRLAGLALIVNAILSGLHENRAGDN